MTVDGHKYMDEFVWHEITPGFRCLSLSFKLKRGVPHGKHEEIEINLDKDDVGELLEVLFKLYGDAYSEGQYPIDWEDGDQESGEVRTVLTYCPEFGLPF